MNWQQTILLWVGINLTPDIRIRRCSLWQHGKAKRVKRHGWTLLEIAG